MPERVRGQDAVPDGQREQVDDHPAQVRDLARGDDDQHARQAEHDREQDERDGRVRAAGDDGDDDEDGDDEYL